MKRIVFLFPILRLLLRKIHLLCQRRLFLPRDFGVSRELSGFNGSFFRREQAPALLLTVNSALLIIGFRATTQGLFSGEHTGSFFGRPRWVAPTLYSVIAKPIRNSRLRIANYEFFRNAEDSVPYDITVKFCVFTDSRKGCPYDLHRKNIYIRVRAQPVINCELRIANYEFFRNAEDSVPYGNLC